MSDGGSGDDQTIAERIRAAEPAAGRPLGGLVDRLAASGALRGAREGGRPIGPGGLGSIEIRGLTHDSRQVVPGGLFVAVPGSQADGHEFVAAAALAGAAAAIVERPVDGIDLPLLVVGRSQASLASAAAWWYGDPSHGLGVVGVTGTDGKTTTAMLAVAALEAAGLPTGLVSTVATRIGGRQEANEVHATTPEAPALQARLRAMAAGGDVAAVVETTSHGLALDRVGGIAYDAAILTNVTHEHLEFHGTWEAYRDAKLSLFDRLGRGPANPVKSVAGNPWPKVAIVNADDPSGELFGATAREVGATVLTYGVGATAQVRATRVEEGSAGLRFEFTGPAGSGAIGLRVAGRFNVHNALAVLALGTALGLDGRDVRAGLEAVESIPGRMERVDLGQPFRVVVDYAHSPASLEQVLDLLAPLAAAEGGGLIAVFGSAGERDTAKRPLMGRIAGERCRLVIVTDEDPRGEDPLAILDEIAAGAEATGRVSGHDLLLIRDRAEAIAAAFDQARPGDIVLMAGKGHERSIIGPEGVRTWDERAEAEAALRRLGFGGRAPPAT